MSNTTIIILLALGVLFFKTAITQSYEQGYQAAKNELLDTGRVVR